jgi:hypothetical protein
LDTHQPKSRELRDELDRKVLSVVPLDNMRPDFGLRELPDTAAKQLLVVGQAEIHDA